MGMLAPVVTEAWRTKPCTGLLSGDDLSIPGGVKPAPDKEVCRGQGTNAANEGNTAVEMVNGGSGDKRWFVIHLLVCLI